ncbi:MAG: helix-turn-helix transcriptional regulator [Bryobacteraceae bacterium]|jgi:transcriptional regulator with XRE-family HTH domain
MLVAGRTKYVASEAYQRFRKLLTEARKAAGLTQSELSSRLKRPQSFVSKYERGERRLDVVEFGDVAKALGVDPIRFLRRFYKGGA